MFRAVIQGHPADEYARGAARPSRSTVSPVFLSVLLVGPDPVVRDAGDCYTYGSGRARG